MTHVRRLVLVALLALAVLTAPGAAAPARAQGGDTAAVAVNTSDSSSLFKFAFQVRRTMKDVVDNSNAAVAYASCTDCRTVAVSFQVLLVGGDPSTVTPTNLALAINQNCTSCDTAAFAYQFVLGEPGPLHFTAEGNQRIAALRKHLRDLETTVLTDDQLAAALDAASAELRDILANQVVAVGKPASDAPAAAPGATAAPTAEPPPAAAPAATATPTPAATTTPEPTATPTATPSATPTATSSATP
jgi:putative peptide zinc metalloprotease protein